MPPKSNVPIRIGGSKTRTGCRTCKNRHVKCDEERPTCLRCRKANRQCVYEQPQPPAPRQRHVPGQGMDFTVPVPMHSHALVQVPGLNRSPSPYGPRDPAEVNATMHFAIHLGRELAGCFSSDVWCQILPRVAQVEPSIWHAMAAIGALDTGIRLGGHADVGGAHMSMAIRQYSKAIQGLNTRLQSGDQTYRKDVVLISCILFAVFECMQSHVQSALLHISSGTRLLLEWAQEAQSATQADASSYLNHKSLLPVFLALDSQAIQMGAVGFRDHLYSPAEDNHLQTPESFADIEEAHVLLSYIWNRISHWAEFVEPTSESGIRPDEEWMTKERQWLRAQLGRWDSAFNSSLRLLYPQPPILLLLIQRTVMQAFFDKQLDGPSEMAWDNYLLLFKRAVQHAEEFMLHTTAQHQALTEASASQSQGPDTSKAIFTVAMDIVMPLFLVGIKCRDRQVRRRALSILKVCGRKEGIWDSYMCAKVVERIIELEEANAAEDGSIPENARIHILDVTLGEETGGEIVHKKLVQDEHGNRHIEVVDEATTSRSIYNTPER